MWLTYLRLSALPVVQHLVTEWLVNNKWEEPESFGRELI
jgi:hypothetical protein